MRLTPRVRVRTLVDSDSVEENRRKRKKIAISRVRVRNLCDSESEEDKKGAIRRVRVGKLLDLRFQGEKIAIPTVRVLPSMPSVGTRRSTRVFVPKTAPKTASDADLTPTRVLRSGKRLLPDSFAVDKLLDGVLERDDELLRCWKQERTDAVDCFDDASDGCIAASADAGVETTAAGEDQVGGDAAADGSIDQLFGIVYSRKRRRRSVSESDCDAGVLKDRMYGIPFVRKQRRKKQLVVEKFDGFLSSLDRKGPLLVSVKSSWSSLRQFSCLLFSVLGWMMTGPGTGLSGFRSFLLSYPMASVFGLNSIRFESEPNCRLATHVPCRGSGGICTIYGVRLSIPLVSVNFAALPFFFMGLHSRMYLGHDYLPDFLTRFLVSSFENSGRAITTSAEHDSCIPMETGDFRREFLVSGIPSVMRNVADSVEATEFTAQNVAKRHGSKPQKHQKKRSSLRVVKAARNPSLNLEEGFLSPEPSGMKLNSFSETSIVQVATLGSINEKSSRDLFSVRDDFMGFPSPRASLRQKRSARNSPIEKTKELKSALLDLKQNIDSAHCNANILVIESDRCWREDGAEVMLECLNSKEWFLAVKIQGSIRYLHKAQELKASTSNRYTHAIMWTVENGWKLEFCDRKDWLIFKELHRECSARNAQAAAVRMIPIPGVQEISGYMDETNVLFLRPDMYISVRADEVERALMSHNAYYDMDSEDEAWLEQLNCSLVENDDCLSFEIFEKIIFDFEKYAYSHPDDAFDVDRATELCVGLGRRDMVAAIFEYWSRKRKQKQAALVRVFQGPPPKRAHTIPKHFLRKKRSFKRQASQHGRGKTEDVLQAMLEKESLQRVQEAERKAKSATELAVLKRRKAQMLMQNADLATYKAVIAMRFADAAEAEQSADALLP